MKSDRLIILDSNSLVHRSYHALPPLTLSNGEAVQAVYGFMAMFLKAIKDLDPQYVLACFDVAGKNFRHEVYQEYKAHRAKAPDDLYSQIPHVQKILKVFGVPIMGVSGFEADDLIATLAVQAQGQGCEVYIVSGDLDNTQSVNDKIKVYGLGGKGIKDTLIYDALKVRERFGVNPDQVVDYKAIAGDASDNIPGGKGLGPKFAQELLAQYKGIKEIFALIESGEAWDLNQKTKDLLLKNKSLIELSYKLAAARLDAPVTFKKEECIWGKFEKAKVEAIFKEYKFFSLINRL